MTTRFCCTSCDKVFTNIDSYKSHVIDKPLEIQDDCDNSSEENSDIIVISSELSSVEVSPLKDQPSCSQEVKPNIERLRKKSRHLLKSDERESPGLEVEFPSVIIQDTSSDDNSQQEKETKKPRELLVDRMQKFQMCHQCTSPYSHFHVENKVDLKHAILYVLLSKPEFVCKELPVNIRQSKCLLLDTSKLGDTGDCTCDEMPWLKQKGKICKQYLIQEKDGQPFRIWPKGKNLNLPDSCHTVKAFKSVWVHSLAKGVQKTMIEIEGNPVILNQYTGMQNQPQLKMSKRRVRPSTTKLVNTEVLGSKSTKRIVHDITSKVSSEEYPAPSALPTFRSVTWVKEKKKSEAKKSAFIDLCHKMAEEEDTFIKCHQVSGNVVSIVLFNDTQITDLKKFCTNPEYPCSSVGMDTTFQFGSFYVVTTSYRHPFLQNREGKFPTLLGPIMVTHRLRRESYRVLFDTVTRNAPELACELKAFVTDGELALQQAASEAFPCALALMCLTHMERNIKYKIRNDLKLSNSFYNTVVKDLSGDSFCEGLIHSSTYEEFTNNLQKLKTKWNALEKLECDHREPSFFSYFEKNKAQQVYDHCLVRLTKDLHLVSNIPDNNPPESMHSVMRRWQGREKKDIPTFVEDMRDLVKCQQVDIKNAFLGNDGPYTLREEYRDCGLEKEKLYGEGRDTHPEDFSTQYQSIQVRQVGSIPAAQGSPDEQARLILAAQGSPDKEARLIIPAAQGSPDEQVGSIPAAPGSCQTDVHITEQNEKYIIPPECLDVLIHITDIQKHMIINRARKLSHREGFIDDTLIFQKAGKNQGFWTTSLSKGTYICKCPSFKAFQICEHTLVHASKDMNLKSFITLASRKKCDADAIANIHGSDNAGKKGAVRVRKGRSTENNRIPLAECIQDVDAVVSHYNVRLTGPLKAQFTSSQPAVEKLPEKPNCPPTLGEPFFVKPVAGTSIRSCFGCSGPLRKTDMCVAHKQVYVFYNVRQKKWIKTIGNKHFHMQNNCIRAGNNPAFDESLLVYTE